MLRTGFSFLGPMSQGHLLALLYVLLGLWVVKEGPRVALCMRMEFGYVGWDVVSWRPYKARAETGRREVEPGHRLLCTLVQAPIEVRGSPART